MKMIKSFLISFCLYVFFGSLYAQNEIEIGITEKLYSNSLNQELELQVYLPQDYEESERNYPTLYVLDGQWYFTAGVAIQESLRGGRFMPKMIVVGINMVDRPYRSKLFNQWDSFITSLESEVVDHIDNSFRTSDDRIVFGWENSGFLTSELILRENSPFKCAIASNGAYINPESLKSFNNKNMKFLFIAGSTKDIYSIDDTDQAAEALEAEDTPSLNWKYELFNEEIHESLAYTSMYQGLKFFYHNYGSLVFSSIDEFHDKGGMTFLEKYFQERGLRFGLPTEIDASTKNSLIWLAWKRDRFDAFDLFMEEFKDVLSTPRYANAYWQNRLAQYYLQYNSYDKAIEFFERGINEYPDDRFMAAMHIGLGSSFLGNGDKKLAKKHFKKGVDLARSTDDPKLKEYEELSRSTKN